MNEIYFEAKGEALLDRIGMPKAEFARRMGIQRQNVKALFKSKDLRVIQKAAEVMDVPWEMLVGYAQEPDWLEDDSYADSFDIAPEDIPTGDSVEDRRKRQEIIF